SGSRSRRIPAYLPRQSSNGWPLPGRSELTQTVRRERIRDAERTRSRILDAARREFGIKGFDGARVDAIARRARVNKGLIFYYFQSKEELFRVLSEQRIASTLPTQGEPVDWPLFLFAQKEE